MTEIERWRSIEQSARDLASAFWRLDSLGHIVIRSDEEDRQAEYWLRIARDAKTRIMALTNIKPQRRSGSGG